MHDAPDGQRPVRRALDPEQRAVKIGCLGQRPQLRRGPGAGGIEEEEVKAERRGLVSGEVTRAT